MSKFGRLVGGLLWRLRLRNRFVLAWWAFKNPDNLTMLRHELAFAASDTTMAYNERVREWQHHQSPSGAQAGWWLKRFLNLPVR